MEAVATTMLVEKENWADVHRARDITIIVLTLSTFLDSHQPNLALFSSTAERMVRHFAVFEAVVDIDTKCRLSFYEKKGHLSDRGR